MVLGIVLIAASLGVFIWLEKRKFYRTSGGGVQQFESYSALWKSRFVEFLAKAVSLAVFTLGVVCLFKAYAS